jgi:ATP:corrinoid adenosyltransferase
MGKCHGELFKEKGYVMRIIIVQTLKTENAKGEKKETKI